MDVTIFSRNACGACMGTKMMLERAGIPFTEINVEEWGNEHYQQELVDEGWRAMPVVKVGQSEAWAGMNKKKLDELIAKR